MVDALEGHGGTEYAEAAKLSTQAAHVGSAALTRSTIAVATASVKAASKHGAGPDAVARELRAVRSDPAVAAALAKDLGAAGIATLDALTGALWAGFQTAAKNRAAIMGGEGVTFSVQLDDTDRIRVAGWPIVGHTASEAASHLMLRLRYDIDAALGVPLTGGADPAMLPTALGQCAIDHGTRLAAATSAAYFAGIQAAVMAIGEALVA